MWGPGPGKLHGLNFEFCNVVSVSHKSFTSKLWRQAPFSQAGLIENGCWRSKRHIPKSQYYHQHRIIETYLSWVVNVVLWAPVVAVLDAGCGALEATTATSGNCCLKFANRSSAGFRELVLWRAHVLELEVGLGARKLNPTFG